MRRYKIHEILSEAGDVLQVLSDLDGMPCYYPNLYATAVHRQHGRSTSTILQSLHSIRMAMDWFSAAHGADFNDRVINGDPLLFREVKPLADFMKMNSKRQDMELKLEYESRCGGNGKAKRSKPAETKHSVRTDKVLGTNSPTTSSIYINYVCCYLDWIYKMRLRPPLIGNFSSERQALAKDGLAHLRAQIPRIRAKNNEDERLWSITEDIIVLVESIIRPNSARNPWQSPFHQDRNYLLWRMFHDTGGRRDEMRNVKVSDVNPSIPGVTFRVSKTFARTVPFKEPTRILFELFILNHWQRLPKEAREAGYLFTNSKGGQLSDRTLNNLFEAIRRSDPRIPDWLSPHTLRRTWNDNFSKAIDDLPEGERWNSEREVMVRNGLMGWTENSKTAETYLRRHIRKSGHRITKLMYDPVGIVQGSENGGGNGK